MEGDVIAVIPQLETPISIHSLRMEGDVRHSLKLDREEAFQSTPSAWRETPSDHGTGGADGYFNPLPPHGGRPDAPLRPVAVCHFNPLPPHGGRQDIMYDRNRNKIFQSTPSAWRETDPPGKLWRMAQDFNPLPPHGGRPEQ